MKLGKASFFWQILCAPTFWLSLTIVTLILLLSVPLAVPIGPMYWDTYIYLDAAQRIGLGQIPGVDFSTPAGPLGYYLFSWGIELLPNAQPLLLAQWCMLIVISPLLGVVISEVSARDRKIAFALLIPALIFAVSPSNAQFYHVAPGVDGFGTYNRHGVILLYVLTSGLLFLPDGRKLVIFCAATMTFLFLTKITGFLVGGLLCVLALLSGRISLLSAFLAALLFIAILIVINWGAGLISYYLYDIATLIAINQETILSRFRSVALSKIDVLVPVFIIFVILFLHNFKNYNLSTRLFDASFFWVAVASLGGIFYETQNTGSQEFVFLWPILVMIFERVRYFNSRTRMAFLISAAFFIIPTVTTIVYKTVRFVAVMPIYVQPDAPLLKNIQQISSSQSIMERALILEDHYAKYRSAYESLASQTQSPSWQFYTEIDIQMHWIVSASKMIEALKRFEADKGLYVKSIMSLDVFDPFAWVLDREPTRHLQIGRVPFRTVSEMTPETRAAIEATEGVLKPKCPATMEGRQLAMIYADALKNRKVVALTPCWDLLLRRDSFRRNDGD